MKIATSFFAALIFIGTLGASGAAVARRYPLLQKDTVPKSRRSQGPFNLCESSLRQFLPTGIILALRILRKEKCL
jgi:hypothetical protein